MSGGEPNSIDLEMKLAFLERTVEELHEVVLDQANTIEALTLRLNHLEENARQGQESQEEARQLEDDRPPHW